MKKGIKAPVSRENLLEGAEGTAEAAGLYLEVLTPKGIDQAYLDNFNLKRESVTLMKTDEKLKSERKAMTAYVKEEREKCYKWCLSVKRTLARAFGKNSAEINEFPADYSRRRTSDALMIDTMPAVISLAEKYIEKLAPKGITQENIEAAKGHNTELIKRNGEQIKQDKEHESYTVERNIAQKELYDMVNEINLVGRELFEKDPVKLKYFETPWVHSVKKEEEETVETEMQQ